MKFFPYPQYKDSGVAWLGKVPEHWGIRRIKYLFKEIDRRSSDGSELLLSMTRKKGLIPQSKISERNPTPEDLVGYKICLPDEIVMNRMQAWSGMFFRAKEKGLISPDYAIFHSINELDPIYFEHLFRSTHFIKECRIRSKGIGSGFNRLYGEQLGKIYVSFPNIDEQSKIVNFILYSEYKIAKFIRNKQRLIELLKEQKQAIINEAVTRGINPNVKMKPSGVDWGDSWALGFNKT